MWSAKKVVVMVVGKWSGGTGQQGFFLKKQFFGFYGPEKIFGVGHPVSWLQFLQSSPIQSSVERNKPAVVRFAAQEDST